ncbi:YkgJ family cysteine cluster protein [Elusimicrobiota bacterium]
MEEEIKRLKETILKEYPRLTEDSEFTFECHKNVKCFNDCCADVNIFLTPYDIIRLKNALGMVAGDFLKKYTILPFDKNLKYPVVLLKMGDDEKKACPLVKKDGCSVYNDRPWPCRMYPLGLASPKDGGSELDKEFYFLLREGGCEGFNETKKWTVGEWLKDQGINEYSEMGKEFKYITLNKFFYEGEGLTPKRAEMFFMACYDIDKFREFVFNSSFLDKFEIDEETKKKCETDDTELLKFAFKWLRFSLFGELTLKIKEEVFKEKKNKLEAKNN